MYTNKMHRRRGPNFTYVSGCVKYMIFVLNFIFWLFGGLLIGVGLYAFIDKWQASGLIKLDTVYDVMLNISLLIALLGGVVSIVSFAGCIGALRENTCLLKFYSLCLLILFLVEMGGAVCGFVFPRSLHGFVELSFTERIVHAYRDDPDLQNFIDYAQKDFHCCGLTSDGYMDWSKNEYFNCSSPSVEKCGVPFSCCINATDISSGLVNIMCGYGVQNFPVAEASKRVWTSGCIEIVRSWAERNLYTIASVALGVALSQLFVIYLAKTLEGQIELQKARQWIGMAIQRGHAAGLCITLPIQIDGKHETGVVWARIETSVAGRCCSQSQQPLGTAREPNPIMYTHIRAHCTSELQCCYK